MPASTATEADSDALFAGGALDGVKPLLELVRQREFRIIVPQDSPLKHYSKWFLTDLPSDTAKFKVFNGYTTRYFCKELHFVLI